MSIASAASKLIPLSTYTQIGFQIGTIIGVEPFPKARNPSYKVTVNFNGRQLISSAQLPPNYPDMQTLFNKQVVSVTNLPPRKIAGFNSQCLIVGFPDPNHHVHLLNTRGRVVKDGLALCANEKAPETIVYDTFASVDIRAGTVLEMQQIEADPSSYFAKIDLGESLGTRKVALINMDEKIATELVGTQIAVLINIQKESIQDDESYPLTFEYEKKRIPLGVDAAVPNGVQLF